MELGLGQSSPASPTQGAHHRAHTHTHTHPSHPKAGPQRPCLCPFLLRGHFYPCIPCSGSEPCPERWWALGSCPWHLAEREGMESITPLLPALHPRENKHCRTRDSKGRSPAGTPVLTSSTTGYLWLSLSTLLLMSQGINQGKAVS